MLAPDADTSLPGIYLHIPFCVSICPYCDFAVHTGDRARREQFVDSLLSEIDLRGGYAGVFDTIYLGGGTPSRLATEQLARILERLRDTFEVEPAADVFLEVNPEDVNVESLTDWRQLGVSFLSLGVQSFDDRALQFLGRNHTSNESRGAVELAKKTGFKTISLDLIYGLPDQSLENWQRDLNAAIELQPDHFSCYQLTVHRKTVFGVRRSRGLLGELGNEDQAELFARTHEILRSAGYPGYEVSSFAGGPENESRHNRKYWDHTPYLGLGPSAHSFSGRRRWWNVRSLKAYEERIGIGELPTEEGEDLSIEDLRFEALMLGLRTSRGVNLERFRSLWGLDLAARNDEVIDQLVDQGHLVVEGYCLIPSASGWAIADRLALQFDVGGKSDR
jgi:oxygen-independent coproporphyrinogen-3 oxidase